MKAGINAVTAALLVGIGIGLVLTPDGRTWLRHPTLMFGGVASASSGPGPGAPAALPDAGPVLPTLTPLQEKAARGSLRIGVFGDSMGDGLWTALYRDLRTQPGVSVTKFSQVSTGLSRYDYVDIQARTARQIAEQPVDVAVILFGTNDAQGISMDGEIHDFGTEGWKAAYAKRVDDLVAMLRGRDIAVYWVGLPRMKRAGFDARMTLINQVVSARMTALGVPFIETESLTENADGDYDAYLAETGTGRRRLMRANDGIHMSMAGYLRIAEPVAARLKRDAGLDVAVPPPPAAGA
ncbi:DUF459 domain-containing protein [Brevundimonas sp. AJA228-03]|uniref:SGNH/GDSL hydrolase family protein n=1 Tax=Brevundimonas sp. AJA228-03 TaxID=2752515 RepID=UPI001ADF6553|nr:DUF459 domain-containing protein [Brevundimonas sp. AJA228-03]QTN18220.1 DUF459 domain-containing protein [Brevundimonas sp. AJA228-03]